MAAVSVLKNQNITRSQQWFDWSSQNLAPWRMLILLTLLTVKKSKFWNPRWWPPTFWKIENSPYLRNHLTDGHKIWYGDAVWTSWPFRPLKFSNFKNPRWQLPFCKIKISPHLSNGLTDYHEIWHRDACWPSWPLKFWKMKIQHVEMFMRVA